MVRFEPTSCRGLRLFRFHQHGESHFDELFVVSDREEGASHVVCHLGGATLLHPIGQLQDGCFEGELVFVELRKQGRE